MSESLLVTYCAPTLAGLKTGNLFNCSCTGRRQAEETVRQWNRTLNPKGVYAVIMRYPIEDVKDFIKNEGKNCKLAGTWKVYHDEQNARKTFCKFKKCTDIYCQMLGKGTPLRRLTVAG